MLPAYLGYPSPMRRLVAPLVCVLAWGAGAGRPAAEEPGLALDPVSLRGELEGVVVLAAWQGPPLPGRTLDVSFLTEDRLAVLSEDGVCLYRRDGQALKREDRRPHTAPLLPVRAAAGSIRAVESERAFWVAANLLRQARLYSVDGQHLVETQQADALPGGLRYRAGTNVMDLGGEAVLRVRQGLVVSPDGRLGTLDDGAPAWTGLRVGDAVARPWPRVVASSSPRPPGAEDAVVFHELGPEPRILGTLPLEGSVRAMTARRHGAEATLAVAVRMEDGDRLLFLRLRREDP
jgi:hypothetical protein